MLVRSAFILCVFLTSSFLGFGQVERDTSKVYKVVKQNGMEYVGKILKDDGREVLIVTDDLGMIYLPKSDIRSIRTVEEEEIASGNFREVGPFTTRYYFTNNALPITKKEHYAMVHLYGPEVHFALTDNFSLGVMSTWAASPLGLAMKYSFQAGDKVHFSLGTIMLSSGYLFQAKGWGGLHWASMTYGQPGKNINISAGYGYVDLGFNDQHEYETGWNRMDHGPVFSVGGLAPVGKKGSFIFDSMFGIAENRNYEVIGTIPGTNTTGEEIILENSGTVFSTLFMPGMRFQNKENRAFQIALAGIVQYSTNGYSIADPDKKLRTIPFPMCSWFFKF
ncbi:hypothetical protein K6119_06970 [Paracrocinitomix mangrovi]|uniref:hypothetical protein n=1 Tax=Paracrocinitomix mangrovi TaxID=2862509 RepID=UPI001C8E51EE|nr:hypothetical protein [Paracrocinitomix mangrovi]UKN03255.1 hypothetical protein K6119_06970 [Paracrocinitomix mangrovi]